MSKKNTIIIILLFLSFCNSQSVISGHIIDEKLNPIHGALVTFLDNGAFTDSVGHFDIPSEYTSIRPYDSTTSVKPFLSYSESHTEIIINSPIAQTLTLQGYSVIGQKLFEQNHPLKKGLNSILISQLRNSPKSILSVFKLENKIILSQPTHSLGIEKKTLLSQTAVEYIHFSKRGYFSDSLIFTDSESVTTPITLQVDTTLINHGPINSPNVIIILADDLGYGDLGSYGNKNILTPNLDYLAKNGAQFTDFHSNGVVCSPTRAALLTGNYQQRSGVEGVFAANGDQHVGLAQSQYTIADYFKDLNFETAIIGKWHLGGDSLYSPINNGFNTFHGFVSGNIDNQSHVNQAAVHDWWINKSNLHFNGYTTHLITRSSNLFIDENKNKPFFLFISHSAPHYPYQGPNDKADRKENGTFDKYGSREDRDVAYKEMVEELDKSIGELLKKLEDHKLLEKTFLFLASDNGAIPPGSNLPLNGWKKNVWEGGHRVPGIAFWKGTIQPKVIPFPVLTMDLFPTIVEMVNDTNKNLPLFDGSSVLQTLLKNDHKSLDNRFLFWRFGANKKSARKNYWKYIYSEGQEYLYYLKNDLSESTNLITTQPPILDTLKTELQKWEDSMKTYPLVTTPPFEE